MNCIYEEVPVTYVKDCEKVSGVSCMSKNSEECETCNEIGSGCVDEAIDYMVTKGYDVDDVHGPYISDEPEKRGLWVMWVKAFKIK